MGHCVRLVALGKVARSCFGNCFWQLCVESFLVLRLYACAAAGKACRRPAPCSMFEAVVMNCCSVNIVQTQMIASSRAWRRGASAEVRSWPCLSTPDVAGWRLAACRILSPSTADLVNRRSRQSQMSSRTRCGRRVATQTSYSGDQSTGPQYFGSHPPGTFTLVSPSPLELVVTS